MRALAVRGLRRGWLVVACVSVALGPPTGCASDDAAECPACPECPEPPPPVVAAKAPIDAEPLTTGRRKTMKLLGFGSDDVVAFEVGDDLAGSSYQVYDAAEQKILRSYPYTRFTADAQWRKVVRAHDVTPLEDASQRRSADELVLLGSDRDDWVVVYVMKGERAVPYFRVPRLKADDGALADVRVKRLAWTPDGRYAVVVHTQGLRDPRPWESDFVHFFAVEDARLPF